MKKYIKPIPLFLLISASLAILAAFRYDTGSTPVLTNATGSTISSVNERDKPVSEIPLPDDTSIHEFCFNPAKNTICLVSQSGNTYQLFLLGVDQVWSASTKWIVSAEKHLIHFVYGTDGKLYACMRTTQNKHMTQSLVRLKKDGTVSKVPLKGLEEVPEVSGRTSHTITDIRFSGTTLAITYENTAVKFYNVEEGQALGDASIRGEAHHNIFYKYHYLSSTRSKKSSSQFLKDHDIRTGEQDHKINLTSSGIQNKVYWLDNYREKVWVLSDDGIFTGKYTENHLLNVMSREELALPEISSVREFLATRDNVLYTAYIDGNTITHLVRIDIPLISDDNEAALKNGLDFSPSV